MAAWPLVPRQRSGKGARNGRVSKSWPDSMLWTRPLSKRPPRQPRSRGSRSTRNPIRVNRRIITRPCPILATLNNSRWHPLVGLVRLLKCVPLRPAITNNNCSSSNNTTTTTTRTTTITSNNTTKCSSSSSNTHRSCPQLISNTTTTTTTITTTTTDRRITIITDLEVWRCRLRHRLKRRPWCRRGSRRRRMGPTRPTRVPTACRPIT